MRRCSSPWITATDAGAQSIQAVRTSASPRLDGRLIEAVWQTTPAITNLTQREPDEGAPAIENTEVRFAYDDGAPYVGARMFSGDPKAIRALITRRDREGSSEQIVISLDTYRDRRTTYTFSVTPAGVRVDYYHASTSTHAWPLRATVTDSRGASIPFRVARHDAALRDGAVAGNDAHPALAFVQIASYRLHGGCPPRSCLVFGR
jgi:hypothetical protein